MASNLLKILVYNRELLDNKETTTYVDVQCTVICF